MKTKIFAFAFFLLLSFLFKPGYSCTTFCIHTEDELVFGKNYDWMISYGIVLINKKDVVKSTFTTQDNPAKWVSKYGSVTFNQFGREFPMGGMNEAGLVVELMWLEDTKYPSSDDRPVIGGVLQWIQYQLDNCETVQEVIDTDKLIRIPSQGVPIHYLIADKYGSAASIEFLDEKLIYHTQETLPYKTLTNDTYEKSVDYLKGHNGFGGTKEIISDGSSLNRFAKSCSMIKNYTKQNERSAVDYGFEILSSVSQSENTKWSIIYDVKNMTVHYRTYDNTKIKNINFKTVDFSCSSPVEMIDINSDTEGNAKISMKEYTYEANRKLIENSYNGVDFLKGTSSKERDLAAQYPGKLNCRSKSGMDEINVPQEKKDKSIILWIGSGLVLSCGGILAAYKFIKFIKL